MKATGVTRFLVVLLLTALVSAIPQFQHLTPNVAHATAITSHNVALVPKASGEGCCAGTMPTSGNVGGTTLSFSDFQFTDLPVTSVNAAKLAAYDTLVLLQVNTDEFTAQQKADINSFVDNGGKLIIYDSDATHGVDYSWLSRPFSTARPCPNCGLLGGTLTIVENDTLGSIDPTSPV